jgi:hypothetical protein
MRDQTRPGPKAGATRLGEAPPRRLTRRTPSRRTHGAVDYTLAKRALLRDVRVGLLSRPDVCDAHPELLRAARYLGMEATRPCPVCQKQELRLLAYVFADALKHDSGRPWSVKEALLLAARVQGSACYVVEVCTGCSWNHLSEAYLARHAAG